MEAPWPYLGGEHGSDRNYIVSKLGCIEPYLGEEFQRT